MQSFGGLEGNIEVYTFPVFPKGSPANLDTIIERKKEGNNLFNRFAEKVKNGIKNTREKFKEYKDIIKNSAWVFVPYYIRFPLQEISRAQSTLEILKDYSSNSNKSYIDRIKSGMSKIAVYGLAAGVAVTSIVLGVIAGSHVIHSLPSSNHIQYIGSQNGYEAFVPYDKINYNGHTDPVGDLILNNGTTLHNTVWNGQYANTIIQNHNQIVQLNNQFVGQTDPVNGQQYVPLQDFYVIKGQIPIEQVTINGQTYYVIQANIINPANIAGFYTYQGWVTNFVVAMNTQGTIAAVLPVSSPVFNWTNTTGTVAYQTIVYEQYGPDFTGRHIVELFNKTIIPYGTIYMPGGASFTNFIVPQQVYNPSS